MSVLHLTKLIRNVVLDNLNKLKPKPVTEPIYFTPRELEVAGLIATGITNKEIGFRLGISEQTVKNHVSNMLTKIGKTNYNYASRVSIARWFITNHYSDFNGGDGI